MRASVCERWRVMWYAAGDSGAGEEACTDAREEIQVRRGDGQKGTEREIETETGVAIDSQRHGQ
jgi:hypothetical protein